MSILRFLLSLTLLFSFFHFHAQDRISPKERNFQNLKEHAVRAFEGMPVKGAHKRMRRAMYFLERHLDAN
ncbi:MAG: hypothetical protein R3330_18505, partial [Saprospiraceae bacterium]|nr:hypothetical protein [Saprospiraceae bacterium]